MTSLTQMTVATVVAGYNFGAHRPSSMLEAGRARNWPPFWLRRPNRGVSSTIWRGRRDRPSVLVSTVSPIGC